MSRMEDCPICRKHRGALATSGYAIFADVLVYVGHAAAAEDGTLPLLGHFLVEPRRHVPGLAELGNAEAQALGLWLARTSRLLQMTTAAEHIYVFVFGHHVDHLHVHVVPRYPGTPREYWGQRVDEWPGAPRGSHQAVNHLCAQMRAKLAEEGT